MGDTKQHENPEVVTALRQTNQHLQHENELLQHKVSHLESRLSWFEKQIFGQKADKLPNETPAAQANLFAPVENSTPTVASEIKLRLTEVKAHIRKESGHGKKPWSTHLPRLDDVLDLPDEELGCRTCNQLMQVIGEDRTEILERVKSPFFIRVLIRPKYACKYHPEAGVRQHRATGRFIDKGSVGDTLVTSVVLGKYVQHLPLTRQEKDFKRQGIDISVSTMVGWMATLSDAFTPVVDSLQRRINRGGIAYSDDTSIPVLTEDKPGGSHRGAMWLYSNGKDAAVYSYTPGRSHKVPLEWLKGFKGYLHSDGYDGYSALHRQEVVKAVFCWAHARRKFLRAFESGDRLARRSLSLISRLFLVDRYAKAKGVGLKAWRDIRERVSRRIVEKLYNHWDEIGLAALPKSLLGEALGYVNKRREGFKCFLKSPRLCLDNNLSERHLRKVVIGRKNYMFCGSEEGAKRAAVIYSLVGTCEMIGLDPYRYFEYAMGVLSLDRSYDPARLMPHQVVKDLPTLEDYLASRLAPE